VPRENNQTPFGEPKSKAPQYGTIEYTIKCLGCGTEKKSTEKQNVSECCSVSTMIVKAELK
jgi:hypothetical protein